MPFEIGQTIGSYRLIQQMGQGGMATVYKAYHAALDRYVAIKVLHPVFTEDASFLARFQREAKTVARMDHPNIVPIYDYSEFEGRPYLVMKFIEGETLKAHMARGALSREEILQITRAVGSALSYAHRNRVLHRDIKPSNVLLSNDGQIYLADFGLARMAQSGESSLTADRLIGTPQYMSPEQALSKPDLDARTDIYSFGVMLYEMLVGRVPFNADTPFAVIHDHIYTPLPLPRQVKPDLPEAVERVLLKALAKNPDDRFSEVEQLVNALELALTEGAVPPPVGMAEETGSVSTVPIETPLPPEETIPTLTPAGMPAAAADAEKLTISPVASPKPSEPPAKKRLKTGWVIGGVVVLVLLMAFCLLVLIRFARNQTLQRAAQFTPAAQESIPLPVKPTLRKSENRDKALSEMDAAINAWKKKDIEQATIHMNQAREAASGERAIYEDMLRIANDAEAPLLFLLVAFDPARDVIGPIKELSFEEQLHRLAYWAAGDPLAKDYFMRNQREPLLQVASIRFAFLHEQQQPAKDRLGMFLNDRDMVKGFPEAHLLEAEFYMKAGDPDRARKTLSALLEIPNLPEWIKISALEALNHLPK